MWFRRNPGCSRPGGSQYKLFTPETAELEGLGYGTLWLGGSPTPDLPVVEDLLAATETLKVGTSIVNIWTGSAEEVAEQVRAHIDAGADHLALQALGEDYLYLATLRALAPLLTQSSR